MYREILISSNDFETRVALIEDGQLCEVWMERAKKYSLVGNIYLGRVVKVLPGLQAAFVDIGEQQAAFMHVSDLGTEDQASVDTMPISQRVHEGEKLIVQVYKDPIGSKGARITTALSIPSRYLVMMPHAPEIEAISARITDDEERQRLQRLLAKLNSKHNSFGLIARTHAEFVSYTALYHDWRFLNRLWDKINCRIKAANAPELIYSEFCLAKRVVRDLINDEVTKVSIDHFNLFQSVKTFLSDFAAEWGGELQHHTASRPLFDLYQIDDEIDRSVNRTVPLKSGGNLVFDSNEAMTTIDVNTGQYVGYKSLEDTAFKTNLESAQMIARQLRLRNIGGIIIIDFIDMFDEAHRQQVLQTLADGLQKDRAKTHVLGFTRLGLVEVTRKRTTESLLEILCETCDKCHGSGRIETIETVSFKLFREISRSVKQFKANKIMVIGSSRLVQYITEEHSTTIAEMEDSLGKRIAFQAEDSYQRTQHDVVLL
ncbi:Rne/Rng family ribonuclease [Marinicella gelatinilytica]|uniref:Rne/Rng family ribonuclease n=1 Tax=Marinicella gelatinilytica TaxID=2996017 RepID=UPI002260CB6A|nr:Rne/Rng family ribonuclease [Marinicella gelatinilytica]MCX7544005.1 Rne/Rng family ribonuclease [Marinicella gelatinilytica]